MDLKKTQTIQDFLKLWVAEFEKELADAINETLYQGTDRGSLIPFLGSRFMNEDIAMATVHKSALLKFGKGFTSLCTRNGITVRQLTKRNARIPAQLPSKLVDLAKELNSALAKELSEIEKELPPKAHKPARRRARLPRTLAFEIFRLIHFYRDDGDATRILRKEVFDNYFPTIFKQTLADKKSFWISRVERKIDKALEKKKVSKGPKIIAQINQDIRSYQKTIEVLREYQLAWHLPEPKGDAEDTGWANSLKGHLLKIIITGWAVEIIPNLDGRKKDIERIQNEAKRANIKTLAGQK